MYSEVLPLVPHSKGCFLCLGTCSIPTQLYGVKWHSVGYYNEAPQVCYV